MEVENDNFTDWCERAGEVVQGMTRPEKVEWYKLHRDIMDEPELLEPSACAALLKKLK
jgi:hypothetical protein